MNNAEQINSVVNNLGSQLKPVMDSLAKGMGVATEKAYEMLIRQAMVDGIFGCILSVIMIVIIIVLLYNIKGGAKHLTGLSNGDIKYNSVAEGFSYAKVIIGIFASIILFIVLFTVLKSAITAIVNPEYYAFQKVIKLLTTTTGN